jgi:adenylate cyclase
MGAYKDTDSELKHGMEMAKKGVSLHEALGYPHTVLGQYYCHMNRDFEKGASEAELAMSLEPSSATVLMNSAFILHFGGRYQDAVRALITAKRLSPIPNPTLQFALGRSYGWLGKYEEALEAYRRALQTTPNHMQNQLGVVATLMLMGHEKEARTEAEKVLAMDSNFSLETYAKVVRQTHNNLEDVERLLIGPLRKAGLK